MKRSFKTAVFLFVVVLLVSSCATQKRCAERFPCTPVDTVVVEKTEYRDTTIFVKTDPITVHDSVEIVLPCPDTTGNFKTDTAKIDGEIFVAKSWVAKNSLHISVKIKGQVLAFKLDSAIRANEKTVTIYKEVTVEKKVIPPFYRATLYVSIILILLFVVIIFVALRM